MLMNIDCTEVSREIRKTESAFRFEHSVSVAQTNVRLNHVFNEGLDDTLLTVCGLLHDICREWTEERLVSYSETHHLQLQSQERMFPCLLHAPVASNLLFNEGYPTGVCTAIRWHTLGSIRMGRMGLIVFISDYLEPLRTHITEEQRKKLLSHKSLDEVCLAILEQQDQYFQIKGKENAPSTKELEAYLKEGKTLCTDCF
ncbi:MAG: HD domain-containing protein [Sphaerochaetaceae bacterium]